MNAINFRKYAVDLIDAPRGYAWGEETEEGTDCSGSVCYPLIRCGYKIRTTADDLYKRLFLNVVRPGMEWGSDRIMAVFYVTKHRWTKLSGERMPENMARHVTPVVGRYVVLQADYSSNSIFLATASSVREFYENEMDCRAEWRELHQAQLKRHSDAGDMLFGLDQSLRRYLS